MNVLNTVVSYWLDCIKCENALEQEFSVTSNKFHLRARIRAMIFDAPIDPFIFCDQVKKASLRSYKQKKFAERASLRNEEIYYGYPLLLYKDDRDKLSVAPLFLISIELQPDLTNPTITRAEPYPSLGTKCLEILGLRQEEILSLSKTSEQIFQTPHSSAKKLQSLLELIEKEASLAYAENIDPSHLSSEEKISEASRAALYNKAILFTNEPTIYNLHLLRDLEELHTKEDLASTALNYLARKNRQESTENLVPILPFKFDEHQLNAIQHILGNDISVVTGPPGTGKSQFISNLIINLFFYGKKVLFVSHTGEAVRVVNERVNDEFNNLMMLTGKKELRQELSVRLETMVNDHRSQDKAVTGWSKVENNWQQLQTEVANLQANDKLAATMLALCEKMLAVRKKHTPFAMLKKFYLNFKIKGVKTKLSGRVPTNDQENKIEELKQRHVEICNSFVSENYLSTMFQGKNFGAISRFIDGIVAKKYKIDNDTGLEETAAKEALEVMGVWSCTLKSLAASFPLSPGLFDYVIFDEASQIDLPSAAPALYRARRAVVVGDPKQLNHISTISPEQDKAIARSLGLADIKKLYPGVVDFKDISLYKSVEYSSSEYPLALLNHYRSTNGIAQLFNTTFYGGKLNVLEPSTDYPRTLPSGVFWENVSGTSTKFPTGSRYNNDEVAAVVKYLRSIIALASKEGLTIGIVTPYNRQKAILAKAIEKSFDAKLLQATELKVDNVHRFQGSQADIIIFSTVIASKGNGNSDSWYRTNYQILNVAVSRARHLLVIVGDEKYALTLEHSKYKQLAQNFEKMQNTKPQAGTFLIESPYEMEFFKLLKAKLGNNVKLLPKLVVDGRFTVDFAIKNDKHKLAVELDGEGHEIIGGLPVPQDHYRDKYLGKHGWEVVRIPNYELIDDPGKAINSILSSLCSE